jgi:parvulin-like peptidyl-prolyl isomerase
MSAAPFSRSNTRASTRTRPGPARVLLLALAALLPWVSTARAAIVEEIVAKVNNRIISKSEFEERSSYILKQIYQQYSGADLDEHMKDARQTMLANMITELLLVDRSQTLLDLDKVRKNLIDDFRKQQNITSDEDLERLLKEQGMTRKDLEEQLLRLAVPQEMINYEVRRKISVSDAEIKQYYDEHQKDWETPPTVTFNEIVLFYEDANRPEVDSRAAGVVREARGGTDFADLVQRYSEAPSKENGGFLGPLAAGDLHPAIAGKAFALAVGDISDPIDTGRSLHIIRLVGKTDRVVKTNEEVKDTITKAVRDQKFKPRYERYIRRIWKESQIEVQPKYEQYLVWSPLMAGKGGEDKLPVGAPGAAPESAPPTGTAEEPAIPAVPAPHAAPTPVPGPVPAPSPPPAPSSRADRSP